MTDVAGKIVILGGRGVLGTDLTRSCRQGGFDVKSLDLPEFDITNSAQLIDTIDGAAIIVNCAAYTNVDGAESEYDLAHAVNAEAAGRLGELAEKTGAGVLHISTDFVFDGRSDRPYVETDEPNPINAYGRSKLAGEELLAKHRCRWCIIRVEWTYGAGGRNFVTKMAELSKTHKSIKVVDDQVGSPTATVEVAGAICELLKRSTLAEGIFHFAAGGFVSRYEMARFIFDKLGIDVDVTACKTSDYQSPATRPLNSRFDCGKIQTLLAEPIKPWQGPLERFLEQL